MDFRCRGHQRGFIMNSLHAPIHTTRLVFGALAVVILLVAASAVAASEPLTSDQFAPGWQAHARPLFNLGPAMRVPGRDRYMMPGILPNGDYVLVRRQGDKAEVLDTGVVTMHGGIEKQYVFLDAGVGEVEALPLADVPALKKLGGAR
jgi:hypothetical protein